MCDKLCDNWIRHIDCKTIKFIYYLQTDFNKTLLHSFCNIFYFCVTEIFYVQAGVYGSGTSQNSIPETAPMATTTKEPELATLPASTLALINKIDNYFDTSTPRNVTALVGKSAYLSCRVRPNGNRTVNVRDNKVT